MKIDSVTVTPNVILAPMSGVTNTAFRRLIKRLNPGAVGLVVTEFISIEALVRENVRSLAMMRFSPEERPVAIQIFGHDIDHMVRAAQMAEATGADIVDINSGCPVPKVVKKGGGCELMRNPLHMAELLTAVRRAITVPLTLKIRSGWDSVNRNALEIARIAEDTGVSALAIHGRTRTEMYRGKADWDFVASVAQQIKIPVVGSGDIADGDGARRALEKVSAIMIGRAALANPWVFSEIQATRLGHEYRRPPFTATADVLEQYCDLLLEEFIEKSAIGRLKQFASQVTRRVPGSSETRKRLCMARSLAEFREILDGWRNALHHSTHSVQTVHDGFSPAYL